MPEDRKIKRNFILFAGQPPAGKDGFPQKPGMNLRTPVFGSITGV